MTQKQYFQVKTVAQSTPDPAVFCPAQGYIPDPTIYVPSGIIANMPVTGDGEIQLMCTDQGTQHIAFNVYVNNSGKFRVIVYGNNNTVISNTLTNYGSTNNYDFPIGQGIPASGYTVFRLSITPELITNSIILFSLATNSLFNDAGWRIIAAKFKTPGITSLNNTFQNNPYITDIEFIGTGNLITSAASFAKNCLSLKSVVMPSGMNICTSLDSAFSTSPKLIRLILPNSLPALTTMAYMLQSGGLTSFTFPSSTPLLSNLSNFAYGNIIINKIILQNSYTELTNLSQFVYNCTNLEILQVPAYLPKMQNLTNMLYGCTILEGELNFPEMPLVTNISNIVAYCTRLKKLSFTGAMNLCISFSSFVQSCFEMIEIVMPTSMTGLSGTYQTYYAFNQCYSLQKITLPLAMEFTSATYDSTILYNFQSCTMLTTLTTCNSWPAKLFQFAFSQSNKLVSFNQPTLRVYNISIGTSSPPAGTYWPLNYFEIAWQYLFSGNPATQVPNITLNYSSIDVIELTRILNVLPERPTAFTSASLYVNTCLCYTSWVNIIFNGWFSGDNRKWLRSYGSNLSTIQVGMTLFYNDVKFTQRAATIAAGAITKVGHNMPNGTEVSFRSLTGVSGIVVNHKYYIVNSTTDTWQVSETNGGNPLTITGTGSCVYTAFPKVEEIGATWIRVTFQLENPSSTANVSAEFSFYKKDIGTHKGWSIF